VKVVISQGQIV